MSALVGGASAQSRARRPIPPAWGDVDMVGRGPCSEIWRSSHGIHQQRVTWVFDQGGPVLGYTCEGNPLTAEHWLALQHVPFGPGGIASAWENDAARLLLEVVGKYAVGGGDRVRFLANGSDALDCAVRLARAHTGRERICSIGYHGSSAMFAFHPQWSGVPAGLKDITDRYPWAIMPPAMTDGWYACVVVEVPSDDEEAPSYLLDLQKFCDRTGALLILDEVVTGFRLALGGAAERYGVVADLLCYGKAMSNGRPISAVVGRAELMDRLDKDVFYSNTYNGDPHSCAQVIATLKYLQTNADAAYRHLWGIGEHLRFAMAGVGVTLRGHAPRMYLDFGNGDEDAAEANEKRREFCRRMVARGVVVDQPFYTSLAHTPADVQFTEQAAKAVMENL